MREIMDRPEIMDLPRNRPVYVTKKHGPRRNTCARVREMCRE